MNMNFSCDMCAYKHAHDSENSSPSQGYHSEGEFSLYSYPIANRRDRFWNRYSPTYMKMFYIVWPFTGCSSIVISHHTFLSCLYITLVSRADVGIWPTQTQCSHIHSCNADKQRELAVSLTFYVWFNSHACSTYVQKENAKKVKDSGQERKNIDKRWEWDKKCEMHT